MQVPKFRCTDKLYVQLTYFHCTAFKTKNQPFASNVLTAVSMQAAFQCRDHKAGSFCLTERVPARAPRDFAAARCRLLVFVAVGDFGSDVLENTERAGRLAQSVFLRTADRPARLLHLHQFAGNAVADVAARVQIIGLEMRAGNHVRPEIAREKRLDPALELRLLAREMHHELAAVRAGDTP